MIRSENYLLRYVPADRIEAGELLQATGPSQTTTYGYDGNGNETQAGGWSYGFDLAGQLTSAGDGKTSLAYGYDGDGNLVSSSDGRKAVQTLLWDPNFALPQLALERDSSGATLRDYLYGAGPVGLIAPQAHGQNTEGFYGSDGVGSVIDLTGDQSGKKQTLASYDWGPYGQGSASKKNPKDLGNPLGYTGQFTDPATGLVDLRARMYDPATGRFLTPDPLGQYQRPTAFMQPGVSGGYVYAGDNPLRYTDPSGLKYGVPCSSFWCWVKSGGPVGNPPDWWQVAEILTEEAAGCYAGGKYGAWVGSVPSPLLPISEGAGVVGGCVLGATAAVVGGEQAIPERPEHR